MMTFVLLSLLLGMVLGQRFTVLILVPGIGLALIATVMAGIAGADSAGRIVLTSIAVIATLQIGYLAGTGIRHFFSPTRASRLRSGSLDASMPARHSAH